MGINCELCEDGYFRPSGLDHNRPEGCQPCLCDEIGAVGLCIKDDVDEAIGIVRTATNSWTVLCLALVYKPKILNCSMFCLILKAMIDSVNNFCFVK